MIGELGVVDGLEGGLGVIAGSEDVIEDDTHVGGLSSFAASICACLAASFAA